MVLIYCFSFGTFFDTKITSEKNSYLVEGWLFIGSSKVASVLGMIGKEVLAQLIYKPA